MKCTVNQTVMTMTRDRMTSFVTTSPEQAVKINADECEVRQADINRLNENLSQVVEMNELCREHHALLDQRVVELRSTISSLSGSAAVRIARPALNKPATATTVDTDIRHCYDNDVLQTRYTQLELENAQLKLANYNLRTRLDLSEDLVSQLEQTVDELNKRLEVSVSDKQAFIDMLQTQILIYREDFQCERQDRERAQGKLEELRTELEHLRTKQARVPAVSHLTSLMHPDLPSHSFSQAPTQHLAHTSVNRLSAQLHCLNYNDGYGSLRVFDETDDVLLSDVTSPAISRRQLDSRGDHTPDKDWLRCPDRLQSFTVDQHVELSDHWKVCS